MGRDAQMFAAREEYLKQRNATRVDRGLIGALVHCRLGSSSTAYTHGGIPRPTGTDFYRAEAMGLLRHHPTWHATPQGEGVLIALGMLEGEPAPGLAHVHVLWAVREDLTPNFVAAFADGLVDCWDETYHEWRARAEREFADFVDGHDEGWRFFTTVEDIPRPGETPEHAWEVTR